MLLDLVPGFPDGVGFWLFVALVLSIVTMRRDPRRRGWHDRLAGTEVVPSGSRAHDPGGGRS